MVMAMAIGRDSQPIAAGEWDTQALKGRAWNLVSGSRDGPSSIKADDLPGDVRPFRDQEMDEVSHIFRSSRAREGNALEVFLSLSSRIIVRPFHHPGCDAVDRDIGGKFARQTQCEIPQ